MLCFKVDTPHMKHCLKNVHTTGKQCSNHGTFNVKGTANKPHSLCGTARNASDVGVNIRTIPQIFKDVHIALQVNTINFKNK